MARIAITADEWAETRKLAIDKGMRTSDYLALAVRRHNIIAARTNSERGTRA